MHLRQFCGRGRPSSLVRFHLAAKNFALGERMRTLDVWMVEKLTVETSRTNRVLRKANAMNDIRICTKTW